MEAKTLPALGPVRDEDVQLLQRAAIFRGLSSDDVRLISAAARRELYHRDDVIVLPMGDESRVFIVVQGSVRLYLLSPEGRELVLTHRNIGSEFELSGEELDTGERIAQVLEDDTIVYSIPWHSLLAMVRTQPDAVSSLTAVLRQRLIDEEHLVKELAFYTIKARLAHTVAELARTSRHNTITATHQELAALIWAPVEEITRALRQLRDEGLVDYRPHGRRKIQVVQMEALITYGQNERR